VPTSPEGRSLTMFGYLEHIAGNVLAVAVILRVVLVGIAEIARLYLGRRAIDKAQRGELPGIMDALARWHQNYRK
jgi:hypothetical protein